MSHKEIVGCPYCRDTGVMRRIVDYAGGKPAFKDEPCPHSWSPRPTPQGSLFGAAA